MKTAMEKAAPPALTEDFFPTSFGAFKPVGHIVVVLPSDEAATELADQLRTRGFLDGSLLQIPAATMRQRLIALEDEVSGASGFGSEIQSMRRYEELAGEGKGFLVVRAPDEETAEEIAEIARGLDAVMATRYGRLLVQTLI